MVEIDVIITSLQMSKLGIMGLGNNFKISQLVGGKCRTEIQVSLTLNPLLKVGLAIQN